MTASFPHHNAGWFDVEAEALRSEASLHHPRFREAAGLIQGQRYEAAIALLENFRPRHPGNPKVTYLLAEIAGAQGRYGDAEALFAECVALAPDFNPARYGHAQTLLKLHRPGDALTQAQELSRRTPGKPLFQLLEAQALEELEDYEGAASLWRQLIEMDPSNADFWSNYARMLRGTGASKECVAAYSKAIALNPGDGAAWWGLADLKTFRFGEVEAKHMEEQLARVDLPAGERPYLHFALGKAYADLQNYEKSFGHYARGNALERLGRAYDPSTFTAHVALCKRVFTAEVLRERAGFGCAGVAPIFILGMPRAGSTLVEQILASHSQVEGTSELPAVAAIVEKLRGADSGSAYPAHLARLDRAQIKELGEQYLEIAHVHRKTAKPFFTDKMGGNFFHIGLILLMLPNAKIVDVRRHPLACGFSNFIQMFADEKKNASRLSDIGQNYRDYVELMAHFERARPEKIFRICYEDIVLNLEGELRRLLDYLELPFEVAPLKFHETRRVLTTVSSEQVRTPLYREALEYWRNYDPWLGPLKSALGPVLDAYPAVPAFESGGA